MRLLLAAVGCCAACCWQGSQGAQISRTAVTCSSSGRAGDSISCREVPWTVEHWTARGSFEPSQKETGWAKLHTETQGKDDAAAAFGAGFVEGALTAGLIYDLWSNNVAMGNVPSPQVQQFIAEQKAFIESKVLAAAEGSGDEAQYWKHVGLTYQQLQGQVAGYNAAASEASMPALTEDVFRVLNWQMDLDDMEKAADSAVRPRFEEMAHSELSDYIFRTTHCSALFRVTPELDDILVGHATWDSYYWMLRVFKVYQLHYAPVKTVIQSGYPALLASGDDFYVTSQKLVITETTNSMFNNSLYDWVSPQSVPYWIRNLVANRFAASAKEWHDIFYRWNSGTYNCQWMVLDYKKFTPGHPLPPWTFVVSEQLPGPYNHGGEDLTLALQRGHWPSYNVPYFPDVYNNSAYPAMVSQHGVEQSYQLAPRASIFRRQADQVNTMEDLRHFIRFNSYGHGDPLAKIPDAAIAPRRDLGGYGQVDPLAKDQAAAIALRRHVSDSPPSASGALDAKIINAGLVDNLAVSAVSGPTTEGHPPFSFTGQWASVPHSGMPELFNFSWQTFSPDMFRPSDRTDSRSVHAGSNTTTILYA